MHSDSDANGKDVTTSKTDGKNHYYEWLLLEYSSGKYLCMFLDKNNYSN